MSVGWALICSHRLHPSPPRSYIENLYTRSRGCLLKSRAQIHLRNGSKSRLCTWLGKSKIFSYKENLQHCRKSHFRRELTIVQTTKPMFLVDLWGNTVFFCKEVSNLDLMWMSTPWRSRRRMEMCFLLIQSCLWDSKPFMAKKWEGRGTEMTGIRDANWH